MVYQSEYQRAFQAPKRTTILVRKELEQPSVLFVEAPHSGIIASTPRPAIVETAATTDAGPPLESLNSPRLNIKNRDIMSYGSGNTHPTNKENYMKSYNVTLPPSQIMPFTQSRSQRTREFERKLALQDYERKHAMQKRPLERYNAAVAILDKIQNRYISEYNKNYVDWSSPMVVDKGNHLQPSIVYPTNVKTNIPMENQDGAPSLVDVSRTILRPVLGQSRSIGPKTRLMQPMVESCLNPMVIEDSTQTNYAAIADDATQTVSPVDNDGLSRKNHVTAHRIPSPTLIDVGILTNPIVAGPLSDLKLDNTKNGNAKQIPSVTSLPVHASSITQPHRYPVIVVDEPSAGVGSVHHYHEKRHYAFLVDQINFADFFNESRAPTLLSSRGRRGGSARLDTARNILERSKRRVQ